MATGDSNDIIARLKTVLPLRWFPDVSPLLDGVLAGFANVAAFAYTQIQYVKLQTRISTATDGFLDLIAYDYLGLVYKRGTMTDTAFRAGIKKEILRPRVTRSALIQALIDLTGRAPIIFEPAKPGDTGGYGIARGYGVAGAYGSLLMPYQALVTAFRPSSAGIPSVDGYGGTIGGYGVGSLKYSQTSDIIGQVTDPQILARVATIIPYGTVAWTAIKS